MGLAMCALSTCPLTGHSSLADEDEVPGGDVGDVAASSNTKCVLVRMNAGIAHDR